MPPTFGALNTLRTSLGNPAWMKAAAAAKHATGTPEEARAMEALVSRIGRIEQGSSIDPETAFVLRQNIQRMRPSPETLMGEQERLPGFGGGGSTSEAFDFKKASAARRQEDDAMERAKMLARADLPQMRPWSGDRGMSLGEWAQSTLPSPVLDRRGQQDVGTESILGSLPLGKIANAVGKGVAIAVPGLAALASGDAEAAKFDWLNGKRIEQLRRMLGYPDGSTKGAITYIKPSEFLGATTRPNEIAEIRKESGLFDPYKFNLETQFPFLQVNADGKIVSHEGRHRMASLLNADLNKPVPVAIHSKYNESPDFWDKLPKVLTSQVQGGQNALLEGSIYPLTRGNIVTIPEHVVDVPLQKMGVTLRPSVRRDFDNEASVNAWDRYYDPIFKPHAQGGSVSPELPTDTHPVTDSPTMSIQDILAQLREHHAHA